MPNRQDLRTQEAKRIAEEVGSPSANLNLTILNRAYVNDRDGLIEIVDKYKAAKLAATYGGKYNTGSNMAQYVPEEGEVTAYFEYLNDDIDLAALMEKLEIRTPSAIYRRLAAIGASVSSRENQ